MIRVSYYITRAGYADNTYVPINIRDIKLIEVTFLGFFKDDKGQTILKSLDDFNPYPELKKLAKTLEVLLAIQNREKFHIPDTTSLGYEANDSKWITVEEALIS